VFVPAGAGRRGRSTSSSSYSGRPATSVPTPTWPHWLWGRAPSWSPSTAATAALRSSAGAACSTD